MASGERAAGVSPTNASQNGGRVAGLDRAAARFSRRRRHWSRSGSGDALPPPCAEAAVLARERDARLAGACSASPSMSRSSVSRSRYR